MHIVASARIASTRVLPPRDVSTCVASSLLVTSSPGSPAFALLWSERRLTLSPLHHLPSMQKQMVQQSQTGQPLHSAGAVQNVGTTSTAHVRGLTAASHQVMPLGQTAAATASSQPKVGTVAHLGTAAGSVQPGAQPAVQHGMQHNVQHVHHV